MPPPCSSLQRLGQHSLGAHSRDIDVLCAQPIGMYVCYIHTCLQVLALLRPAEYQACNSLHGSTISRSPLVPVPGPSIQDGWPSQDYWVSCTCGLAATNRSAYLLSCL